MLSVSRMQSYRGTERPANSAGAAQHHTHLPPALTSLLTHHRIAALDLTLSSGRWSPHWPTTSTPASGIELVAWLQPDEEGDEALEARRWQDFTGALGGMFCTGVTSGGAEPSRPDWGYVYEGDNDAGGAPTPRFASALQCADHPSGQLSYPNLTASSCPASLQPAPSPSRPSSLFSPAQAELASLRFSTRTGCSMASGLYSECTLPCVMGREKLSSRWGACRIRFGEIGWLEGWAVEVSPRSVYKNGEPSLIANSFVCDSQTSRYTPSSTANSRSPAPSPPNPKSSS